MEDDENLSAPEAARPSRLGVWLRRLFYALLLLGLAAGGAGYYAYDRMTGDRLPERQEDAIIDIPERIKTDKELADLLAEEKIISDKSGFLWTTWWMGYSPKPGRYRLEKDKRSHRDLIRVLRGKQMTLTLTLHNLRTKEQLAGRLAKVFGRDSLDYLRLFDSPERLAAFGVNEQTVMSLFLPDSYELYWNTEPEELLERMAKESEKFWSQNDRLSKAKALHLSPTEVYILASIVETESQYAPERPTIAGVYLNRLRQGWKLEADPTVVFAMGDFEIRRVLRSHLEYDSPYNTYRYAGLPPGPIYMASKNAIDAVLNAERHEYMFFCAKPGGEGSHAFAKTLAGHTANAKTYQRWLNEQKIYK